MKRLTADTIRPRVLHCITRLGLGGAESVSLEIIRQLQRETENAVFTARSPSKDAVGLAMQRRLEALGVPWWKGSRLPIKAGGMISGGLLLAHIVRSWRPDVLHYHGEPAEACGAVLRLLPGPATPTHCLRTIHSGNHWGFSPRLGNWCDQRLGAARVVSVSETVRRSFTAGRTLHGTGTPPCEIIHNGVSLAEATPRYARIRAGAVGVIYAGRFSPEKGLDVLCLALRQTRLPIGIRGEMTFLGAGPEAHLLQSLRENPPAGWKVTIRSPSPEPASIIRENDLLVLPSRYEGLPLVAIEAVRLGLPVVATGTDGTREVFPVDYPFLAKTVNPAGLAETLSLAIARPDRWGEATAAAQAFARHRFDAGTMAGSYLAIYREMLPGNSTAWNRAA